MNRERIEELKAEGINITNQPAMRDFLQEKLESSTSEAEYKEVFIAGYELTKDNPDYEILKDYCVRLYSSYYTGGKLTEEVVINRIVNDDVELKSVLEMLPYDVLTQDVLINMYETLENEKKTLEANGETFGVDKERRMGEIDKVYIERTGMSLVKEEESVQIQPEHTESQVEAEHQEAPKVTTNREYNERLTALEAERVRIEEEKATKNAERTVAAASMMGVSTEKFEKEMDKQGVNLQEVDKIEIDPELVKSSVDGTVVSQTNMQKIAESIRNKKALKNVEVTIDDSVLHIGKKVTFKEKSQQKIASCNRTVANHISRRATITKSLIVTAKENIKELGNRIGFEAALLVVRASNSIEDTISKTSEKIQEAKQRAQDKVDEAKINVSTGLYQVAEKIDPRTMEPELATGRSI